MDAFICERGIALDINKFIELFGNEQLLKLKKQLTISTVDKITKIPQKTTMFNIVKTKNSNVLELPKFCLDMLNAKKYVSNVTTDLSVGDRMYHKYTGVSNPNQQIVVQHVIDLFRDNTHGYEGATLKVAAGCHAKDTKILMFNGTTKLVQNIIVGDRLMGDDSTPRTVLNLVNGFDDMYQISNVKNESYIVNSDHILCLTYTNKKRLFFMEALNLYRVQWFGNIKNSKKANRLKHWS